MANEIVKYNNDMNKIGLRNFNSVELDILMAIMSRMKEKGLEIIEFDFDYLKQLTKWKDTNYNSFVKALDNTYQKLISINLKIGDDKEWTRFVLFTEYTISTSKQNITIGVNKKFSWVLNELAKNFTRFELEEFVDFKSSYTKEFFRRMKQFRNSGFWDVSLEDFKTQLNVPSHYRITDIDTWVLKPILKELQAKYHLNILKKYSKNGKGRPSVIGFKFTFKKEIPKEAKEEKPKILEAEFEELQQYIGRTLCLYDEKYNRNNYCKILNIEKKDNKYILTIKNIDDDYIQKLDYFESLIHLKRFILFYVR